MDQTNKMGRSLVIAGVRVEGLSNHLVLCAQSASRKALGSYTEPSVGTQRRAAVEVGAALEYLARAVVASWNPGLLAMRGKPSSLLALSNVSKADDLDHTSLRTVLVEEVFNLLASQSKSLQRQRTEFEYVMAVRNAAAHMGFTESNSLHTAIIYQVQLVGVLLDMLDRERDLFWGPKFFDLTQTLEKNHKDRLRIRVETLLVSARERFHVLTRNLPLESREATLRLLESRPPRSFIIDSSQDEPAACPACERTGLLTMVTERGDGPYEVLHEYVEENEVETIVVAPVRGVPMLFQCLVCDLVLEGPELDQFAYLSEERELEPESVDADEYLAMDMTDG